MSHRARFALLPVLLASACAPAEPPGPDLILTGGTVYTMTAEQPFTALAILDDRVVATGTDQEIRALAGDRTQEMPLDGTTVLPGLHDAWIDLESLGRWQGALDLRGVATAREAQVRLRETVAAQPEGWLVGWGWDETIWPRPSLPGAEVLDQVVEDRPVVLYRRAGRLAWVNSAALALTGLSGSDLQSSVIDGPALSTLEALAPEPSPQERAAWIGAGLRAVAAAGITTVATAPLDDVGVLALEQLAAAGDLPIRVLVRLLPGAGIDAVEAGDGSMLSLRGFGLTLDGPYGPRAAALTTPYDDAPVSGPEPDRDRLRRACEEAAAAGLPLDVHAYGDRAVAEALTCPGIAAGEGLLVGADLLPETPVPSAVRLAAVPLRLAHDLHWLQRRLGAERAARTHLYRDLVSTGNLVALASAAPAHRLAPMAGLRLIYTRRDSDGYPLDGWGPQQRLAVADGLRLALYSLQERLATGLEAGAVADLVVWSHDPFDAPEMALSRATPMLTIVGGRVSYSRPLLTPEF